MNVIGVLTQALGRGLTADPQKAYDCLIGHGCASNQIYMLLRTICTHMNSQAEICHLIHAAMIPCLFMKLTVFRLTY